jgi:hypothetical protein
MNWPDDMILRSIEKWPSTRTPEHRRRPSQFRAPLGDTLRLLRRELAAIRATEVALEIAIPGDPESNPVDWRKDGRPRAHARPAHPGVVLVFRSPVAEGRVLRVATDRFPSWQENLRAVAKTLEHQRAFERYGTATRGEAYTGWAQLPSGNSDPSAERGRDLIANTYGGDVRRALMETHPDRGGDAQDFADVQAARGA